MCIRDRLSAVDSRKAALIVRFTFFRSRVFDFPLNSADFIRKAILTDLTYCAETVSYTHLTTLQSAV